MSTPPNSPETATLTPCIGICRLDDRGYCVGCLRTGEEIGRWRLMSDVEREYLMREVLPARAEVSSP